MPETIPILCGSLAGKPSPLGVKMHDAGYNALNLNFKYVAIGAEDIDAVIESVKTLNFHGLGVSMPHKQQIIKHLDEVSPEVQKIGACNTVVFKGGRLVGYNTDWRGALAAIDEAVQGPLQSATIVGSGGAARAIAYGLKQRGMKVFISARSIMRRTELVNQLELDGDCPIENQGQFGSSLIVNATPISEGSECPVNLTKHPNGRALFDVSFQKKETPLIAEAAKLGWAVVPGWRMLLHQALSQFELYTGHPAPIAAMEQVLSEALA